ncbi:MAG: hypothetical protein HY719_02060 [Planctomycetes bacterium]|nr:hypothetical protein [Planctomycetota bacterium]
MSNTWNDLTAGFKRWRESTSNGFWLGVVAVAGFGAFAMLTADSPRAASYAAAPKAVRPVARETAIATPTPAPAPAVAVAAAPAPEAAAPAQNPYREVELQNGDTPARVAARYLDDPRRAFLITDANPGVEFKPGARVRVPR